MLSENENPNVIPILGKNLNKVDWSALELNPNASDILDYLNVNNISNINDKKGLLNFLIKTKDKRIVPLLQNNLSFLDKNDWSKLSLNPVAIYILENNQNKIDWTNLSSNPSIVQRSVDKYCFDKEFQTEENLGIDLSKKTYNPYPYNQNTEDSHEFIKFMDRLEHKGLLGREGEPEPVEYTREELEKDYEDKINRNIQEQKQKPTMKKSTRKTMRIKKY